MLWNELIIKMLLYYIILFVTFLNFFDTIPTAFKYLIVYFYKAP